MPRIRTIKPEIHASEQVADCSIEAAYMFIGIWGFCDDAGRHQASPMRIKGEVFPLRDYTKQQVQEWRDELVREGLLDIYSVGGEEYIEVTGWAKHQKIDNPTYRFPDRNGVIPETPPYRKGIQQKDGLSPNSSPNSSDKEGKGRETEGKRKGREQTARPAISHSLDDPIIDTNLYRFQLKQHGASDTEIAYAESEMRRRKADPRKWTAAYMWPIICDFREGLKTAPRPNSAQSPPMVAVVPKEDPQVAEFRRLEADHKAKAKSQ